MNQWTVLTFFLFDTNQPVEVSPDGSVVWAPPVVPRQEPMLGPVVIFDETCPLPEGLQEMLGSYQVCPIPYGLGSSPRQFLQLVVAHVLSSNGIVERGSSELRSFRNEGRVYMVREVL